MNRTRLETLCALGKGLAVAIAATLLAMSLCAAAMLWLEVSDPLLRALNQLIKLSAIVLGAIAAIGRGGQRGFITGLVLAALYMIIGYSLYLSLGGGAYDTADMLGEILLGAAVGAITGAVLANLPTPSRHGRKLTARRNAPAGDR